MGQDGPGAFEEQKEGEAGCSVLGVLGGCWGLQVTPFVLCAKLPLSFQ